MEKICRTKKTIYDPFWDLAIPVFLRIGSILIEQVFPHLHHVSDRKTTIKEMQQPTLQVWFALQCIAKCNIKTGP